MATSVSKLNLPQRPPRYKFALTPLADAMFQLLIFFMLSSSLTPYSLITLRSGAEVTVEGEGGTEAATPPSHSTPLGDRVLWTVDNRAVIVNDQVFDPEDLIDLAAAIGTDDDPADVILILRPTAQVQDVAWVLEALRGGNIASVQVTRAGES